MAIDYWKGHFYIELECGCRAKVEAEGTLDSLGCVDDEKAYLANFSTCSDHEGKSLPVSEDEFIDWFLEHGGVSSFFEACKEERHYFNVPLDRLAEAVKEGVADVDDLDMEDDSGLEP